ncbi:MAG: DUF4136 domain-containing protein [Lentisphaeria bacterium]|nr:DUF4136 domain-containing protein [Lentisphaeria bacterium]
MRVIGAAGLVAALLLLSGCDESRMKTRVHYDPNASFDGLKTYAWMSESGRPTEGWEEIDETAKQRIVKAVDDTLTRKGLNRVAEGNPDFLLGCHVGLNICLDARAMNAYYNYPPGWPWNYLRHSRELTPMDQRDPRIYLYDRGSFVVDVVRTQDAQLVWRGAISVRAPEDRDFLRRLLYPGGEGGTFDPDQDWYDKGAERLFEDFPPSGEPAE